MRDPLVDGLLGTLLRDDPAVWRAYHLDATYHAEVARLRDTAARAHESLMITDPENADAIVQALLAGLPDLQAAADRIAALGAQRLAMMSGKS